MTPTSTKENARANLTAWLKSKTHPKSSGVSVALYRARKIGLSLIKKWRLAAGTPSARTRLAKKIVDEAFATCRDWGFPTGFFSVTLSTRDRFHFRIQLPEEGPIEPVPTSSSLSDQQMTHNEALSSLLLDTTKTQPNVLLELNAQLRDENELLARQSVVNQQLYDDLRSVSSTDAKSLLDVSQRLSDQSRRATAAVEQRDALIDVLAKLAPFLKSLKEGS